jgi:DnaJ-class molecular chaperone
MPVDTKYYDYLGVNSDATEKQIKTAYRKKCVKYHPDKHVGATDKVKFEMEEKFKNIARAYQVLSDKEKRKIYDMYGEDGLDGEAVNADDLADIFNMFGGGPFRCSRKKREFNIKPVVVKKQINLYESYVGETLKVTFTRQNIKSEYKNSNLDDLKCSQCEGMGQINKVRNMGGGMFQQSQAICDKCNGACGDPSKFTIETVIERINLPKGMYHGQKIGLQNVGNELPDGSRTQVIINIIERDSINIKQKENNFLEYTRGIDGNPYNLGVEIEVELYKAICGGEVSITFIDGKKRKFILPEKCFNETVVIGGLGMPIVNKSDFGNLYITTKIKDEEIDTNLKNKIWELFTGNPMPKINNKSPTGILLTKLERRRERPNVFTQSNHNEGGNHETQCRQQ